MPAVFPVRQRKYVTKSEQTVPAIGPHWATAGLGVNQWIENCCATARAFLFQNPKIYLGARVDYTVGPEIECPER